MEEYEDPTIDPIEYYESFDELDLRPSHTGLIRSAEIHYNAPSIPDIPSRLVNASSTFGVLSSILYPNVIKMSWDLPVSKIP